MLVSHLLYYRFKGVGTAPIIAGLDENDVPVLCTQGEYLTETTDICLFFLVFC